MQPFTCPIPQNINPLQSNGFLFKVAKLPEVSFFCQEVTIPEISLPHMQTDSPLATMHFAGDKLTFGELGIQFLIDENMANYVSVFDWLVGLGFPEGWEQYDDFIRSNSTGLNTNNRQASVSEGTLQILNSASNPVQTISFVDLIPTSLGSVALTTTNTDTTYLVANAQFTFTYYKFV